MGSKMKNIIKLLAILVILASVVQVAQAADWPEGYKYCKEIPVTAADPQEKWDAYSYGGASKQPTMDTHISSLNPTTNYYTATTILINNTSGNLYRGLFEFDITDIPTGADILTATFNIYFEFYYLGSPVGSALYVYKLTPDNTGEAWVDSQATWNIYKTGENWDTAGGDYVTSNPAGASSTVPASAAWRSFNILAITDDAMTNEDKIIKLEMTNAYNGSLLIFTSKEGSNKPYISITYQAQSTPSVPENYKLPINLYKGKPLWSNGTVSIK